MRHCKNSSKVLEFTAGACYSFGKLSESRRDYGEKTELRPSCRIYFAVRGAAVVNDSVEEDAYAVGIDAYARVISNGDSSLGTVLHRTSEEFQEIYQKADIIIAKGQANYECLSEEKKNIYFLLLTKCRVIADDIGIPEMKMICMKHRYTIDKIA